MQECSTGNKKRFLSIGVLAKSFGVNESTIRRIEAAGLFKPALIVSNSGYRYYDCENVSVILEILLLKSFGFTQEDIRAYLIHPGDYLELFRKLEERQVAINSLVDSFRRRTWLEICDPLEVQSYESSYCICKKTKVQLTPKFVSSFSKEFLFETIQEKIPINYTKPLLVCTECFDYQSFQFDTEQEYTFCIPVREKIEHPQVCNIPSNTALCLIWNGDNTQFQASVPQIESIFEKNGFIQSDRMCIAYETGYLGDCIPESRMIAHILIPVRCVRDS